MQDDRVVKIFDRLVKSLLARDDLSADELAAIAELPYTVRDFRKGMTLIEQDSRPSESCLILEGLAGRVVYTPSGKRHITALHIAGDFVDLHGFLLKVMDHSVTAMTDARAVFVPHSALHRLTEDFPHLTRMLWLLTTIDAAIHRAWLTCVSRKSPRQHLAHLFCELSIRNRRMEIGSADSFDFSVTQAELSDMLGLSLVHTNRTVQELRGDGLVRWDGKDVEIPDLRRLAKLADFDETYLNFRTERR